jgi:hypothetical protein
MANKDNDNDNNNNNNNNLNLYLDNNDNPNNNDNIALYNKTDGNINDDTETNLEKNNNMFDSFKKDINCRPWNKWLKINMNDISSTPSVFDYIFPICNNNKTIHHTIPTEDDNSEDIEELNF